MTTNNSLSNDALVLAIDIGTTSLKAAFISGEGEVFSFKRIELLGGQKNKDALLWAKALKEILPDPLAKKCGALSVSGNGPTLAAQDGTSLMWRDDVPDGGDGEGERLFEKIDIPESQREIYRPRLLAFKRAFPRQWKESGRLWTSTGWLCNFIKKNAAALGLSLDLPVIDSGPDFMAALIGTGTIFPGRLCDRAGSSEGLNLCSKTFVQIPNLRTMPSPRKGLWNISCLVPDPGKSDGEKNQNCQKAFLALKAAAAENAVDFPDCMAVTGGQALNENLLQKKADALGIKINLFQIADSELLGDAAAAFFRLGKYCSLEEAVQKIVRVQKTFVPKNENEKNAPSFSCKKLENSKEEKLPKFFNIPKEIKGLLFDIDSTLYTNQQYAFEQVDCQVRRFAALRGISNDCARKMVADFRKEYAQKNGGKKVSLSNVLLHFGISIERSVQWRRELIEPADFLGEDKELRAALLALLKKYKLLCVTNNPLLPAKKTLAALGVEDLFSDVIGLDELNLSKPAKEPFELAAKRAGLEPCQIVSVGDRYDLDIAPALELGMGGVLVGGVKDVRALPGLL